METHPYQPIYERLDQLAKDLKEIKALLNQDTPETESDIQDISLPMRLLSMTRSSVYALVHNGKLEYMKKGKRLYFSKKYLINYIKSGKREILAERVKNLRIGKGLR